MNTARHLPALALAGLALVLAGCGGAPPAPPPAPDGPPPAIGNILLDTAPAGARDIAALRKQPVKAGDEVTVHGRIGGRVEPFVKDFGAFVLADDKAIVACDKMGEDDHCETPWDFCCTEPEDLAASIATIQVLGDDGDVLAQDIDQVAGLAPGGRVTVRGLVAEGSSASNLLINATGLHVHR